MKKTIYISSILLIFSFALLACEPVERSASKVLDNAGSVVRSGSEKLFIETTPTPEPLDIK